MANSKISALTSATTPLAGTETLPIVQSSATKQVSITNVTAGRVVTMSGLGVGITVPTELVEIQASSPTVQISASGTGGSTNKIVFKTGFSGANGNQNIAGINAEFRISGSTVGGTNAFVTIYSGGAERMRFATGGDITVSTGNLIQGTAAKGVNFTANTPAAGMTSQLLNWYEEGTWTPNQGAGLTLVGAFSSTGRYTRIGRQVSISGTVTGATSVAVAAAGVITSNLPFTVGTAGHGDATNAAITASAAVICTGTSVTSAGAITATATITFSATYFV
jgi:hypothetical protein